LKRRWNCWREKSGERAPIQIRAWHSATDTAAVKLEKMKREIEKES